MHLSTLVLVIGGAWLAQYAFTFMQIRHYRRMLQSLVNDYRDQPNFYLFSGISRKAFSTGGIAALIVDHEYQVQKCFTLTGATIFSRFKPFTDYNGKHVGTLLSDTFERIHGSKTSFKNKKSMARALNMAAENALKSISSKKMNKQEIV